MRALIGAVVLAGLVGSAPACDDDEIEFVAIDGSVIKMRSGATFHVISSDQLDASMWLALDDVLICKDETEIINKDHEGERVTVKRLRRYTVKKDHHAARIFESARTVPSPELHARAHGGEALEPPSTASNNKELAAKLAL